MLKKKDSYAETVDSLIGENIKIIGKIEGKGNLRIDGMVEGDIDYEGNVTIGETGTVKGNVKCGEISLSGTINGNIFSRAKLELLPTGILVGDVEVDSFVIHENAKFDGSCKMTKKHAPETSKEKSK
ncbi:MAG: polymer-forming cytoskeletal protein [Tissierellaceae bacterium]|nr:polymer-forming cytoskeletal protein [Tissierellaceae bacterium]